MSGTIFFEMRREELIIFFTAHGPINLLLCSMGEMMYLGLYEMSAFVYACVSHRIQNAIRHNLHEIVQCPGNNSITCHVEIRGAVRVTLTKYEQKILTAVGRETDRVISNRI